MTARELQKAIMEDLRELFATDQFKTPDGKMASPGLYPQFLPQLESDDDTDPFPYIIVRIDSGGIETQTDPHKTAWRTKATNPSWRSSNASSSTTRKHRR